jgi:hypothetical protein
MPARLDPVADLVGGNLQASDRRARLHNRLSGLLRTGGLRALSVREYAGRVADLPAAIEQRLYLVPRRAEHGVSLLGSVDRGSQELRHGRWLLVIAGVLLTLSRDARADSAAQLYLLNCWGCHRANGEGIKGSVPRIRGFGGFFLHLPEGRAYFASVPGVANSSLSDAQAAQVLDWMLRSFSRDQLPPGFTPYAPEEIKRYRLKPITEVVQTRKQLIERLVARGVISRRAMQDDSAFNQPPSVSQPANGPPPAR